MTQSRLLKKDLFGEIRQVMVEDGARIVRDSSSARAWIRWLARKLMRREARVLQALDNVDGVPALLELDRDRLSRSYLPGTPMHLAKPRDCNYFNNANSLLRQLHCSGVVHNDLAKEPNLLVRDDGSPAFIDFQLAGVSSRRGRLFRLLAYEDLRHLLKHKRSYCASNLTRREIDILDNPSFASRVFMSTVKPLYLLTTRRLLGWADREGAGDRGGR